jgi:CDP-6-deoxy-D-xylo-4-hexulose-3-dehydrase
MSKASEREGSSNAGGGRTAILELVDAFYASNWPHAEFVPGETPVPVSGRVFDADEIRTLVDCSLDFWLTTGRYAAEFEKRFAQYLGVRCATLCNSGSSANLLAISALTSSRLGDRRLQPGDEVLTVAAGFPTTVNPIIQNGLIPVFVDVDLETYNVNARQLEAAVAPRTRAIILAHTLGNPFEVDGVLELARRHNLWVIEDNCDALGSTYKGQLTGSFGDLATFSFYPAHHITMGEGGCVVTNQPLHKTLLESFRDWGRDCWCEPGKDNTCGKRFQWQLGSLCQGYDHKYIYSHLGYNLKLTDMQAAVGVAQMKKLPRFIEVRRQNFARLMDGLKPLEHVLMLPRATPGSDPSWFGFAITVRPDAPFSRHELLTHLHSRRIGTRLLFGGSLDLQPAYSNVAFRAAGKLTNSRVVMERTFWIGVYPGLTGQMLDYVVEQFHAFVEKRPALAKS